MKKVSVRAAKSSDFSEILDLYAQLIPDKAHDDFSSYEKFEEMINSDVVNVFVAIYENRCIVGTCILYILPNLTRTMRSIGLIENMVISKDYRRMGIGRSIVEFAIDKAREKHCYKVMLAARKNDETLKFYSNVGFIEGQKLFFQVRLP